MAADYVLARSLCDAVGWDPTLMRRARDGQRVPEVEDRCGLLRISAAERVDILALAADLCTAVSEHKTTHIRVVASRPELAEDHEQIWGIGQEWLEMIRHASKTIVVIAPSIDAAAVLNLQDALVAAVREGVELTVVYGALGKMERIRSAIDMIRTTCESAEILEWPKAEDFLHAKAICTDDSVVYIGSANLTEFGWERNVELGLTLSGVMAQPLVGYCLDIVEIARSYAAGRQINRGLQAVQ